MSARTVLQRVIVMIIGCILLVQQPVAMPPLMTSSMPVAPKQTMPGTGSTMPTPVAQMPTNSVPVQTAVKLPQAPAPVSTGSQLAIPAQSKAPVPAVMPAKQSVPVPTPQAAPLSALPTSGLPAPVPAVMPIKSPVAIPNVPLKTVSTPVVPVSMPVAPKSTMPTPVAQMPINSVPVQTAVKLPQAPASVFTGPQLAIPVQSKAPAPAVMPAKKPVPVSTPQVTSGLPGPVPVAAMPVKQPVTVSSVPLKSTAITSQSKEDSLDALDDDSQDIGLSTIELEEPQGNWLYKRLWWERAENRFEKIRSLIDAIWSLRSDFFSKRTELDKTVLDPFYLFIGAGQGEFREIVADIIKRLQKAQQADGDLDEQERALLADLQDQKKALDTMQKSIDAILTLDHDVDIALSRLMEQLNRARDYEREAWQSLKDIARELSDKKAQEIFYHMETIWKNLKGVHKYIQGEFANHFNTLIKKVTNEVNTTKQIVQTFKTKGIDLKDRADKLEQADKTAHDRALEKKAKEEAEQKENEEVQKSQQEEEEELPEQGWIGWIVSWPMEVWNNLRILIGL